MVFFSIVIAAVIVFLFYRKTLPALDNRRKSLLIFLRLISITIVLLLLLNPVLYYVKNQFKKPTIVFLHDSSESMQQKENDQTKIESLLEIKEAISEKVISSGYQVKNYEFANGISGDKNSTYLKKSLVQLKQDFKNTDIEEIILLSDGWYHDDDLSVIEELDIPVSALLSNYEISERDLSVEHVKVNRTGFLNEITPIIATVKAIDFSDSCLVELYINNELIETRSIDFSQSSVQQLVFEPYFEKKGLQNINVKINVNNLDETVTSNNVFPASINILDKEKKILIISDFLNWDVTFLKNVVKAQQGWEVTYLNKKNELMHKDEPVELEQQMKDTSVLVLVNEGALDFSTEHSLLIKNYLGQGGGILIQGRIPSGLSDIAPSVKTNINKNFLASLILTENSKRYESFNLDSQNEIKDIPPVDYFYVNPKLQSEILARFNNEENSAAIIFEKFEKGKILHFSFLNLWKWQLWADNNLYKKFIGNMLRWLSQEDTDRYLASTNKTGYFEGDIVHVNLEAYDEKMQPLKGLSNKIKFISDNNVLFEEFLLESDSKYLLELEDLPAGRYNYEINEEQHNLSTTGKFEISNQNNESRNKGFNKALLSYMADNSGGNIYKAGSEYDFSEAVAKKKVKRNELPLYRKWYILLLFLISFSLEIYLRIRWGLL